MLQYFYGPDTYAARQEIQKRAENEKASIRWVDHSQLSEQSLADMVGQGGGLFGKTLVVVRDPSLLSKAIQEGVAEYVEKAAADTPGILWDREMPDKRSKLWRAAKPIAREFPAPAPEELCQWLIGLAEHEGGALEREAAAALVARLPGDRWRLENELRRLLLIALNPSSPPLVRGERTSSLTREGKGVGFIDRALVEREIIPAETAEIFATLDAIVAGERARAATNVQALLQSGLSEFYILSMLAYQFRTLLAVRAGIEAGQAAAAIARIGKLHPYVVEKSLPRAQRLPATHWRDGLTRILATDFAIKQGRVDARTGLLMLVFTLAQAAPQKISTPRR